MAVLRRAAFALVFFLAPAACASAAPLAEADPANLRFSPLDQITAANVANLAPVWTFSTGVLRGHEGAPLIVGGVLYIVTPFPNIVYALDLDHEGRVIWKYEPRQDPGVVPVMCCDTASRGLAYDDGKIFLYQADTTLVALDAKTGSLLWSAKNGDPSKGATGTSAPIVAKGKVIVGVSGGEFGVRGYLSAYSEKDGARVWRAFSVGPDSDTLVDPQKTTELGKPVGAESSLKSWSGDEWKIGGGDPWGRISYDPGLDLIFYGSGNPSTWNAEQRPGANRWAMTLFARDPDTGVARWVYQTIPHDEWDYDAVNEMMLADLDIDGRMRRTVAHFDRNGFAYVLDRATGDLISADKFEPSTNWASAIDLDRSSANYGRPVRVEDYSTQANGEETETKGVCPATVGAKNVNPAAFSPRSTLFYVPVIRLCMDYEPFRVRYEAGQPYTGADTKVYPAKGDAAMGALIAWDPQARRIAWSRPETFAVASGALATAGGVVFYGTLEGYLKAVDAATGRELYSYKTGSSVIGDVTTFEHDGRQYVAVLSGAGGWSGVGLTAGLSHTEEGANSPQVYAALSDYVALGGQLTVFALR